MKSKNKLPRWLRPKSPTQNLAVCVGWYTEEEWTKAKATAIDKDRFEATFSAWVQMAEKALKDLRATGVPAERSYVKADSLLAWCLAHGRSNDAAARAEFVSEQGSREGAGRA